MAPATHKAPAAQTTPPTPKTPSVFTVGVVAFMIALVVAVVLAVVGALGNDHTTSGPTTPQTIVPADPVTADEADRYSGVAQLLDNSSCTASLVDTGVPTGPAYVVTNGHCTTARDLDANEVALDTETQGTAVFGLVAGRAPVTVGLSTVSYSTMKRTDVSVVQLDATLGSLQQQGIRAYALAVARPTPGTGVVNVGVPTQSVDPDAIVLRKGACSLGPDVDLIEFQWLFDDAMSNDCPGVLGGSSGSPLFAADDTIVGLVNTTTGGAPAAGGDCYLGKPCERTPGGTRTVVDRSYAVGTEGLAACFVDGRFSTAPPCPLPVQDVWTQVGATTFSTVALTAHPEDTRIALRAPETTPVRVGVVPANAGQSCAGQAAYTAESVAGPDDGTTFAPTLRPTEGIQLLCVARADDLARAATVVFTVDDTPPVRTPTLSVQDVVDGYSVEPIFSVPELSDFLVKVGPETDTDCDDGAGYARYRRIPTQVADAELPATVCVIGFDLADNETPPLVRVLPAR